jgi:hypothetical protein
MDVTLLPLRLPADLYHKDTRHDSLGLMPFFNLSPQLVSEAFCLVMDFSVTNITNASRFQRYIWAFYQGDLAAVLAVGLLWNW